MSFCGQSLQSVALMATQKTRNESHENTKYSTFSGPILMEAFKQSFVKLDPRQLIRNPVMFIVEVGTAVMLGVCIWILLGEKSQGSLDTICSSSEFSC
jgi:hypothetical protein